MTAMKVPIPTATKVSHFELLDDNETLLAEDKRNSITDNQMGYKQNASTQTYSVTNRNAEQRQRKITKLLILVIIHIQTKICITGVLYFLSVAPIFYSSENIKASCQPLI